MTYDGRIAWDKIGSRFYENGVDHGILFVSNGDGTYMPGIEWNGLTAVTESPDGAEPNDLWADNMKYATLYSNETFGATIEAYTYPEEFAQCDGSYQVMPGVNFGQQDRKPFAFCYRTHVGNDASLSAYKLHIVYNCKASPSEKSYESINDSPDAITFSWEVSTIPLPHGNIRPVSTVTIDESKLDDRGFDIYKKLEAMIYGDGTNPPTLPSVDEIAGMFGTYEGNPVIFTATKPTPVSELKVMIEPMQDLHGYDSISVTRTGKNLFNWNAWNGCGIARGTAVFENYGVTLTATEADCYTYYDVANDRYPAAAIMTVTEGETITLTWEADSDADGKVYIMPNGGTSGSVQTNNSVAKSLSYTVAAGITYVTVCFGVTNNGTTIEYNNIMLRLAGLDGTFEPYQSDTYTIAIPDPPGTVYGGTLDLVSGVLIATHGYIASYAGEALPGKWISDRDVYAAGTSPTTGAQVVYEMASPITYDLSSQQISMLSVTGTNVVTTDNGNTIHLVYREDATAAASSGYTKQQLLNLSDPQYVQNLVRIGLAEQVFDIGDQFNVTWNNGSNTYDCPFDVVHFGKVINEYGQEVRGMYLQAHWAIPSVQFDSSEAIYYASEEMPAGTYRFTIGETWGSGFSKNTIYAFTTTQAIPQGGQILIASSTSRYTWGGDGSAYSNWRVYTYASKESTIAIETLTISQGEPVGSSTNLGTISSAIEYGDSGLNNLQRASRGYNRWSQSSIRQWLNSDATTGSWWTPRNNYDRPPEQLSTKRGFMAGLPENFLSMVHPVAVTTALNTVSDANVSSNGVENTIDTFFLPSLGQNYIASAVEGAEGDAFQYWKNLIGTTDPWPRGSENTNTNLIKYQITDHTVKQTVRLRSANRNNVRSVFYVNQNGYAYAENAVTTLSVTPVCVIC